jgi:hypothetical protein
MKTELKYKTFDQLMNEVATDFTMYNTEGMLDNAEFIKVAQRVNYDLGLRINSTKETIIEICNKKAKLPDDFYVLNYAIVCGTYTVVTPEMAGRQTENVIVNRSSSCKRCNSSNLTCGCNTTYINECQNGEAIFVQVVEKKASVTRVYETFSRIHINPSSGRIDSTDNSFPSGYIKNGYVYTNLDDASLFISYQGALEDEDGNLLVLDHPMINEYYEYAIKQRMLENLYMNGEDVVQKIQLIEQRLKVARNYALTIVNTPNYSEMKNLWEANRRAQYARYYDMFKSFETLQWVPGIK